MLIVQSFLSGLGAADDRSGAFSFDDDGGGGDRDCLGAGRHSDSAE
jgi:hypothetical protein